MKNLYSGLLILITISGCSAQPPENNLKSKLTKLQYHVTQENGTEKAFNNKYWNNKKPGIYVDVVSGKPLFSSTDKYPSGSGWPSFTKALEPENIISKTDTSHNMVRTELRTKTSHIGHLFDDGPGPEGNRYCINSAALDFIDADDLEKRGLGKYRKLFD